MIARLKKQWHWLAIASLLLVIGLRERHWILKSYGGWIGVVRSKAHVIMDEPKIPWVSDFVGIERRAPVIWLDVDKPEFDDPKGRDVIVTEEEWNSLAEGDHVEIGTRRNYSFWKIWIYE